MKRIDGKSGAVGYPEVITNFPQAEVACEGAKGWILQGESVQLVFFEFPDGAKVGGHSHSYAQWGIVVDGTMELIVDGKAHVYDKGGEYLIPAGAVHSAHFLRPSRIMDLFSEKARYKVKKT